MSLLISQLTINSTEQRYAGWSLFRWNGTRRKLFEAFLFSYLNLHSNGHSVDQVFASHNLDVKTFIFHCDNRFVYCWQWHTFQRCHSKKHPSTHTYYKYCSTNHCTLINAVDTSLTMLISFSFSICTNNKCRPPVKKFYSSELDGRIFTHSIKSLILRSVLGQHHVNQIILSIIGDYYTIGGLFAQSFGCNWMLHTELWD